MTVLQAFKVLNLSLNATEAEIKKAFRRLAKKYHPDVCKKDGCIEKFKELNKAYELLKNNFKKIKGVKNVDYRQFYEEDIYRHVEFTLEEMLKGAEKEIKNIYLEVCDSCSYIKCVECNGEGLKVQSIGFAQLTVICNACQGRGLTRLNSCNKCGDKGVIKHSEKIKIKTEPGLNFVAMLLKQGHGNIIDNTKNNRGNLYIRPKIITEDEKLGLKLLMKDTLVLDYKLPVLNLILEDTNEIEFEIYGFKFKCQIDEKNLSVKVDVKTLKEANGKTYNYLLNDYNNEQYKLFLEVNIDYKLSKEDKLKLKNCLNKN